MANNTTFKEESIIRLAIITKGVVEPIIIIIIIKDFQLVLKNLKEMIIITILGLAIEDISIITTTKFEDNKIIIMGTLIIIIIRPVL